MAVTMIERSVADGVGQITLNGPHHSNTIDFDACLELEHAILDLGHDSNVNAILIEGAGGNFCAGGDFDEIERLRRGGRNTLRPLAAAFEGAREAIASVEVPVVAAVNGRAWGSGFELMQAADIALVSDDASIAGVEFGAVTDRAGVRRHASLIGRQGTLGLLLIGEQMSGLEAVRYGLALQTFPEAQFDSGVSCFVGGLAARGRFALTEAKRMVNSPLGGGGRMDDSAELVFSSTDTTRTSRWAATQRVPKG